MTLVNSEPGSRIAVLLIALGMLLFAGCTSMQTVRRVQQVRVVTNPPGALVRVTDDQGTRIIGHAPVNVETTYLEMRRNAFDSDNWAWLLAPSLGMGIIIGECAYSEAGCEGWSCGLVTFSCAVGAGSAAILSTIIMAAVFGVYEAQDVTEPVYTPLVVEVSAEGYETVTQDMAIPSADGVVKLQLLPTGELPPGNGEVPLRPEQPADEVLDQQEEQ